MNGSVVALLTISVEWWTFSESEGQIRQLSSFGGRLNRDIQPFSSVRYACAFIRSYLKVNMALSRGLMPTVFVHQASKTGCYPCSTLLRRPPDEEKWRTRVSDCLNVNLAKNIGESMRERSGAAWIICVMLILFEVARVRCWYCLTWRVYDVGTVWTCAAWACWCRTSSAHDVVGGANAESDEEHVRGRRSNMCDTLWERILCLRMMPSGRRGLRLHVANLRTLVDVKGLLCPIRKPFL